LDPKQGRDSNRNIREEGLRPDKRGDLDEPIGEETETTGTDIFDPPSDGSLGLLGGAKKGELRCP
jgi:hypothetical protein